MNDSGKLRGSETANFLYSPCYKEKKRGKKEVTVLLPPLEAVQCHLRTKDFSGFYVCCYSYPFSTLTQSRKTILPISSRYPLTQIKQGHDLYLLIIWVIYGWYLTSCQHLPKLLCIVLLICWAVREDTPSWQLFFQRMSHSLTQKLTATSGNEAARLKMHSVLVYFNWISSSCTPQTSPPSSLPLYPFHN